MRTILTLLFCCLLIPLFSNANVSVALSGTYTIGGVSPDFNTFGEAVSVLNSEGISDTVHFKVRPGTYTEQIEIIEFPGADCSIPVIFESESGDSSDVILTYNASSSSYNYTVLLNGADGITFKSMTLSANASSYGRVVDIDNEANCNKFLSCRLVGVSNNSTSNYYALIYSYLSQNNNIEVRNCILEHGSYAMYCVGYSTQNANIGTVITNNLALNNNKYGFYLGSQSNPIVSNNKITTNSNISTFNAVYFIHINSGTRISNNEINLPNGGTGMYLTGMNAASENLVFNNSISIGGTGHAEGITLYSGDSIQFYHNSVNITTTSTSTVNSAFTNSGVSNLTLLNNIFANHSAGYAIEIWNTSGLVSDYNNLFTRGQHLTLIGGSNSSLFDHQTATGFDLNSISIDPLFVSENNLHVYTHELNGQATPLPTTPIDFDGEPRDLISPDIGADEFSLLQDDASVVEIVDPQTPMSTGSNDVKITLLNNGQNPLTSAEIQWEVNGQLQTPFAWTGNLATGEIDTTFIGSFDFASGLEYSIEAWSNLPNGNLDPQILNDSAQVYNLYTNLSSVYTIGGTSPDFDSIQEAINALRIGGIADTVWLKIRPGIYAEQLHIPEILGADCNTPIIIESESGDSSDVILSFEASYYDRYTIYLNGADGITFKNMTLMASDSYYNTVVLLENEANCNRFLNCRIVGNQTTSNGTQNNLVYSPGSLDNNNEFRNCQFENGSFAIALSSSNIYNYESGNIISDNIMLNQSYTAIVLSNQDNVKINKNQIYGGGIGITRIQSGFEIINNKILHTNSSQGAGISINIAESSLGNEGLIANNFISGSNLSISSSNYINIYHNNIHLDSTNEVTNKAWNENYCQNLKVYNNIFNNAAGGYAVYVSNGSGTSLSNYNNLFSTGPILGYWNNDQATLSDYQAASNHEQNSISVNPYFNSDTDLHVNSACINNAGIPIAEITHDIDGDTRNTNQPDIGADEFDPLLDDVAVTDIINPTMPFNAGDNSVEIIILNNGFDPLNSLTINWDVNGTLQTPFLWTGNLNSGEFETIQIGSFNFVTGIENIITAWSTFPNGNPDQFMQNDTARIDSLYPYMAGQYTIGGTNPDFPTFNEAIDALANGGISDPVIFKVRPGTYDEQLELIQFDGSSCANTVVFESETGDSSDVILENYLGYPNYVIYLNGADGITFKNMTIKSTDYIGYVVTIINQAHCNSFISCNIIGPVRTSTSGGSGSSVIKVGAYGNDYNFFSNCTLQNGTYGIHLGGSYNSSPSIGTVIYNNVAINNYIAGFFLDNQENPSVTFNKVMTNSNNSNFIGFELETLLDGFDLSFNQVITSKGTGIDLSGICSATSPGKITNNYISVGGSGTGYGIRLWYGEYVDVFYNSVNFYNSHPTNGIAFNLVRGNNVNVLNNIFSNTEGGYAFSIGSSTDFINSDFNNLFSSGPILGREISTYNNLTDYQNATGLDANSISVNPYFESNEDYHVNNVVLNGSATPLPTLPIDIESQIRDANNPDIGALEFSPPLHDAIVTEIYSPKILTEIGIQNVELIINNNGFDNLTSLDINWTVNNEAQPVFSWNGNLAAGEQDTVIIAPYDFKVGISHAITCWSSLPNGNADARPENDTASVSGLFAPLSGKFTIGGIDPDFVSFSDAVTALSIGGITDTVRFQVRSGTYVDQIEIEQFSGGSCTQPVIFESQVRDSSAVTLTNTTPYIVTLDGVDGIIFRDMTIQNQGSPSGNNVVIIKNNADCTKFLNCQILGPIATTTSTNNALIFSQSSRHNNNEFRNCYFLNGSYALYLQSNSSQRETGTIVSNNISVNAYVSGFNIYYQDNPVIAFNKISTNSNYSGFRGLNLLSFRLGYKINSNKLNIANGGYGIYLSDVDGNFGNDGLVSNNFITVSGDSDPAYGIYLKSADYIKIYHNSINITNTNLTSGMAFYKDLYGAYIQMRNNIFANTGGGYAINLRRNTGILISDYNDLFTTGPVLAYWENDYSTLSDYQSATGFESNSISTDPLFISDNDLHVYTVSLNDIGSYEYEVTMDIDGEVRTQFTPDIGADEFSPFIDDASISEIFNFPIPFASGINDVEVVLTNNGLNSLYAVNISWDVNGQIQPGISWTGDLAAGESDTLLVGSYNFIIDTTYSVTVWSGLPNGNPDAQILNDTAQINNLNPALNGSYTIGGILPDFVAFQDAINAINLGGVVDSVTFKVRPGTYEEQLIFTEFLGSGCDVPVVFESETGDSSDVTITYDSASSYANYTIFLDGADGITFKNITISTTSLNYGRLIYVQNKADCNKFLNCHLIGNTVTASSNSQAIIYSNNTQDNYNEFRNCLFENGSYAMYYYASNYSDLETGTVIENNILLNNYSYGIAISDQSFPKINNNVIITNSTAFSFYGILCFDFKDAFELVGNKIQILNGGTGIRLKDAMGTSDNKGLIANNFISVGGEYISRGINLEIGENILITHNNIRIRGIHSSYGAAYYNHSGDSISILNNIFVNSGGGYAIYFEETSFAINSDYNDLITTGPFIGFWLEEQLTLSDLQNASGHESNSVSIDPFFVSDTDLHINNVSLNGLATPLPQVLVDIDGDDRNLVNPDMGADEFYNQLFDAGIWEIINPGPFDTGSRDIEIVLRNYGSDTLTAVELNWEINGELQSGVSWNGNLFPGDLDTNLIGSYDFLADSIYLITAWTDLPNGNLDGDMLNDTSELNNVQAALSGTYTIGGVSPDFITFEDAITVLNAGGILDSVQFKVRPGTYIEQIEIIQFPGSSCDLPVIFESESGDSTDVTLSFSGDEFSNFTINLNGADGVTFKNMTLEATGTDYGTVIVFQNGADCNKILNCQVRGLPTGSLLRNSLIYSEETVDHSNEIRNCFLENGSYAIYLAGKNVDNLESGTLISNNIILNPYYRGIYACYQYKAILSSNEINTSSSSYYFAGISGLYLYSRVEIIANKINILRGGTGILLNNIISNAEEEGIISNNFIIVGGTEQEVANGIFSEHGVHINIYNNSVLIKNPHPTCGIGLNVWSGSNISILNNIFYNIGGGYTVSLDSNIDTLVSDYNNLFTTGPVFGQTQDLHSTFNDYQLATGLDSNSLSVDSRFISDNDLHINTGALENAGIPITEITTDIDGEIRDSVAPDIGADERECLSLLILENENIAANQTFKASTNIEVSNVTFQGPGVVTLIAPMVMISNDIILADGVILNIIEQDGCSY